MEIEILDEVVSKWGKIKFLQGIESDHHKYQLAYALENQRLGNEAHKETPNIAQFKRLSIPIVRRVFANKPIFDLISVQTVLTKDGNLKYKNQNGFINTFKPDMRSKVVCSNFSVPYNDTGYHRNLDIEAEYTANVTDEVATSINLEIINDLLKVADTSTVHEWKTPQRLVDCILIMSSKHEPKIGHSANWIVVSTAIEEELQKIEDYKLDVTDDFVSKMHLRKTGRLSNKWNVYVDPCMSDEVILMGYKGDDYTAGYVYGPYIPLNLKTNLTETLNPQQSLEHLYYKKLINNKYYSKIILQGYSSISDEEAEKRAEEMLETVGEIAESQDDTNS